MADSTLGRGVMEFGGDDRQFQQAADRVVQGMRGISQQMKETGDGVEGLVIKYGRLSIANTAAKSLGRAIEEMSDKVRSGEASFVDLFDKAAKGIPLVGGFYDLGKSLAQLAVDGDASAESMKRQSAELEKQIDLIQKLIDSHAKLSQEQRDRDRKVAVGLAGQNFGAAASALFGNREGTEATAAQVRQQVRERFQAQFEALDKLKRENDLKLQQQQFTLIEGGDAFADDTKLADAQKNAAKLEEMAAQLRRDVTTAEDAALAKIGGGAFVQLGKLAGGEVAKGFDMAGTALQQFIKNIPVANQLTERLAENFNKLAQSHAGNIGQFVNERGALAFDKGRGAISPDLFQKLSDKSFFDQAARSVGSILQQYAPITETIGRLVDSNFGLSNFASKAAAAVGSVFPGKIDAASTAHEFRSSTVGLTDLGRRIQEGAASSGGQQATEKYLPTIDQSLKDAAKALNKLLGLGTVK
jgi:hypothetical protein